MLPGFRFLFAAIVLSMAILVFGLGAAALLRAAHEEFASNPSWHAAPEPMFAQQPEATRPVLAMLRVEPPEQKAPDNVPAVAAPAEPATIVSPAAEPERIDALKPEDSSLSEPAKPEIPVSESPAQSEATPAAADAPADETQIAATIAPTEEVSSPAKEVTATLAEQASPANSPEADIASPPNSPGADSASTKIATLGGPPVAVEAPPPAKAAGAKPDRSVVKKRLQARRAAQRRKIALRARLAQQALQRQQSINPFAQPAIH
jgi:hypothetical protein